MKLVRASGKTAGEVAKDLDLTETALREWVRRARDVLVLDTDRLDYISDLVDRLDVLDRIERFLPRRAIDPRAVRQARNGGMAPASSSAGA